MPPDTGAAFVVIRSPGPDARSHLTELLSRRTKMPTVEVEERRRSRPITSTSSPRPGPDDAGRGAPSDQAKEPRAQRRPIDVFFRSLDHKERAIAIVLSGTGSNGAAGLRFIKSEGGIAIAQDPETAGHSGMPQSAIATGLVDLVLPPAKMAAALVEVVRHPYVRQPGPWSSPSLMAISPKCWPCCARKPSSTSSPIAGRPCCAAPTAGWGYIRSDIGRVPAAAARRSARSTRWRGSHHQRERLLPGSRSMARSGRGAHTTGARARSELGDPHVGTGLRHRRRGLFARDAVLRPRR